MCEPRRATDMPWQGGAATTEFYIVAFFVFIPFLMAILQMGMFIVAKNTVNVAALAVTRAGAASGGDRAEMIHAYAKALTPLYVGAVPASSSGALAERSTMEYGPVIDLAYAKARAALAIPLINTITILNPTRESFSDFGVPKPGQGKIIPVTNILEDEAVGPRSRQTRADALLLKIEVRYCYVMVFPVINDMVAGTLLRFGASPADLACYAMKAVPIVSQAVVRMTVPPSLGKMF